MPTALWTGSLLLLSSVAASAAPSAHSLTDVVEVLVVDTILDRYEDDVSLLVETVNINSGTLNTEGVRAVGEVFAREFDELGFVARWMEGETFRRAGHLIAEHLPEPAASDPIHILLIGHLDTVFEPHSPFQELELIEAGEKMLAKGPGTTDMKGGNVVMLSALHGLKAAGALKAMHISVFLAGDEERVGDPLETSRAELLRLAADADVALGFEDGDGNPATAVIARRGSSRWRVSVAARSVHSSQIFQPQVGVGAIYELARILDCFRTELADLQDLTYSPGLILGGTELSLDTEASRGTAFGKSNIIPAIAVASGDIRAVSPEQLAHARDLMEAIVADSLPGAEASLEFIPRYPPMAASDGNRRLLAIYDQASKDLGTGPVEAVDPRKAGAADVAFVAAQVDMALDGLGLMGTDGHTEEETADLSTLSTQAARAALTMLRVHQGSQP